jgi:uncharacterized protein involved in exopolysaccharide biosynthesis
VYEATARLEIRQPAQRTGWSEQALGTSSAQVENLNLFTCAELVKRPQLLTRLAEELEERGQWVATARQGADRGGFMPWTGVALAQSRPPAGAGLLSAAPPLTIDACVLELGTMINVHPVRDTRLMDIVVDAGSPNVARTIADRLAALYVDDERVRASAADTAGLAVLEHELQGVRQRLDAVGPATRGATPEGGDELVRARRARLTQAMAQLDQERQKTDDAQREVGLRLSRLERYASAPDTTLWASSGNESLDAIHHELVACSRRLAAARTIYRPLHPKLAALDSEYAGLRALEGRSLPAAERELRGLVAYEGAHSARLQQAMADSEQALSGLERREASLGGGVALSQADRDLESRLLDRMRDRLLEAPLDPPPVGRVDAAVVEPDPVRPRKALNVLIGTLVGMLLGTSIALVRRPREHALEHPDEVEDSLEVPVLAALPDHYGEARS